MWPLESVNLYILLMVDHDAAELQDHSTAATIREPQTDITDLNFAIPDDKVSISTPINQDSLLSQPVRT